MKALLLKVLDYLRYPSTYAGLAALAVAAGVNIRPDLQELITTVGVTVVGAVLTFFSDADVEKK